MTRASSLSPRFVPTVCDDWLGAHDEIRGIRRFSFRHRYCSTALSRMISHPWTISPAFLSAAFADALSPDRASAGDGKQTDVPVTKRRLAEDCALYEARKLRTP